MGDNFITIIVVVLIIMVVYTLYNQRTPTRVVNNDGISWNVSSNYHNYKEAAKLLSSINSSVMVFLKYLRNKYHIDETLETINGEDYNTHSRAINTNGDAWRIIDSLLENYNYEELYENDPSTSNETSYTIDKGERMHLCLRNKENPNLLIDEHTLTFVMLHEMSHIANYNDWGHTPRFWTVFKFILTEANEAGIHTPVNYSNSPVMFCGMNVDYNPYFDTSLPSVLS